MAAATILTCFSSPTERAVRVAAAMVLYASRVGAAMAEVAAQPEPRLEAAAPETVGVDSAPLMRMSEWLRKDKRYSSDLTRDHNYELYSVTKTITALAFGVLAGQGNIASSERITPWIQKAHPEFEDALSDTGARRTDYPVAMATPTCHCGLAHSSCAT